VTEQQQQTPSPSAPPANATEAAARLETLKADAGWRDKFLASDGPALKEYHVLTAMIADGGDDVAVAMSGKLGAASTEQRHMAATAEMFRGLGIRDEVTSQFLRGEQVTPQEYELVSNFKKELTADRAWRDRYLGGDLKAAQQMVIINSVLVNGIKKSEAA
jgi:hypothetical protein